MTEHERKVNIEVGAMNSPKGRTNLPQPGAHLEIIASQEFWHPTENIAFVELEGKKILHQCWRSSMGRLEWKPVPTIEL